MRRIGCGAGKVKSCVDGVLTEVMLAPRDFLNFLRGRHETKKESGLGDNYYLCYTFYSKRWCIDTFCFST